MEMGRGDMGGHGDGEQGHGEDMETWGWAQKVATLWGTRGHGDVGGQGPQGWRHGAGGHSNGGHGDMVTR